MYTACFSTEAQVLSASYELIGWLGAVIDYKLRNVQSWNVACNCSVVEGWFCCIFILINR